MTAMIKRERSIAASQASNQIDRIGQLCEFLKHPAIIEAAEKAVPCTMPQTVGGLGFDISLWSGLGVVGLWSALDAFVEPPNNSKEKCKKCDQYCLPKKLMQLAALDQRLDQTMNELDDIRHLFAHNFAGYADGLYFNRSRHVLRDDQPVDLSCGVQFGGVNKSLQLTVDNLQHYVDRSRQVLNKLRDG